MNRTRLFFILAHLFVGVLLWTLSGMTIYGSITGSELISDEMFLLGGACLILPIDLLWAAIHDFESNRWLQWALNILWILFGASGAATFLF
ncbi:MAG: hypothetical protein ISN29_09810 [Gammaproteobacteria bacterium AqS3]|nr:hypothetical protein [Gammaproteobacteria bacterium AqS3]